MTIAHRCWATFQNARCRRAVELGLLAISSLCFCAHIDVAGAADAQSAKTLEEVIVTAQRREEKLSEVPISITVLGGDQLDQSQSQSLLDELTRVAGISLSQNALSGGVTTVQMRGVAPSNPLFSGSSPVGYYLDSIPFGLVRSALVPDMNAYDLGRVEVLRGPQGTLYGVGSLNGVVRVLTTDADLNEFAVKARASTADTEGGEQSYRGDMAVNVPIVEGKFGARAVVGYNKVGGWIDRLNARDINDSATKTYRLKLNATPTDDLSLATSVWLSRRHEDGVQISDTRDDVRLFTIGEPMDSDFDAYSAKVSYQLPAFSITSMTGYVDYFSQGIFAFFGTNELFIGIKSKVFSQEFTLNSSSDGPWEWSFGGIYRKGKDNLLETAIFLPPSGLIVDDASESYAVFGQITRKLFDDHLKITLGLRDFHDDVQQSQANVNGTGVDTSTKSTFTATTPQAVVTWLPSEDLTVYASYGQGFRSGLGQSGTIQLIAPQFPPAKPDKLTNYEVGAKGRLFGGTVGYDAAVYFIDWDDTQQVLTVPNPFATFGSFVAVVNASSASGFGFDFGLSARPTSRLNFGLTFSYNDLRFDDEVISGGVILFGKNTRLLSSPAYTVGANASHSFPLSAGYEAQFTVGGNYSSNTSVIGGPSPYYTDSRLFGRASFEISAPTNWAISLFAENVGNERGGFLVAPFYSNVRPRPRTVGVQMEYHY